MFVGGPRAVSRMRRGKGAERKLVKRVGFY